MAEGKPQSWKFTVGDKTHSVTVINGEVSGMGTEDEKGLFKPIRSIIKRVCDIIRNEAVLNAISRDKFNGQEEGYWNCIARYRTVKTNYDTAKKAYENDAEIAEEQATFYGQDQFSGAQYAGLADVTTLRYPYDMDVEQDHLKITQYEYKRLEGFKKDYQLLKYCSRK